uniref:uncharacterized protein LOC120343335 n=1 Tax=Styela clava TaxID=7725 RepID=UPI00193AB25D|nr:uncharacterized protein LOC120343335 [Styela clava]
MKPIMIAFLVVLMAATGYAIQCYVCSNCADAKKLSDSQLYNCSSLTDTCIKASAQSVVTRSCGAGGNVGCQSISAFGVTAETCICKGEKCNGAGTLKSSIILGSVISLLVAKFIIV